MRGRILLFVARKNLFLLGKSVGVL